MIVIAEKYGQLGNRLFVFAHVAACGLEHGVRVSNPSFDEYAGLFESTRRDLFCRHPARRSLFKGARARRWLYAAVWRLASSLAHRRPSGRLWEAVRIGEEESFDLAAPGFVAAAKGKPFVFVQGWQFRDEARLRQHAAALRRFFAPAEPFAGNVAAHLSRARAGCDVLVGVHVRQGDYRHFEGGRYFYETAEYARLMREVEGLLPGRRVGFLVCSNAAHEPGAFAGLSVTPGTGHLLEDMYSLAGCDYVLGPPSTYTLWASFYGGAPLYHVREAGAAVALDSFRPYGD